MHLFKKVSCPFSKIWQAAGESDAEPDETSSESDGEDEEGEDESIKEDEAQAEQRVRALLMSVLATKRTDEPIKMDILSGAEKGAAAPSPIPHKQELRPTAVRFKVLLFAEDQLGMVLKKGRNGETIVASTSRQSPSWRSGIVPGDVILGVNAVRASDFNQVLWLLRHVERPMHLVLLDRAE